MPLQTALDLKLRREYDFSAAKNAVKNDINEIKEKAMSAFKKFYDRKVEEVTNANVDFKAQTMMGTHPITSRQPAYFHFMLTILESKVPDVNKSEVIFEAVKSAYQDICSTDDLAPEAQQRVTNVRNMLLNAWGVKCARLDSDSGDNDAMMVANEASKKIADDFIADYSSPMAWDEIIEKYRSTYLGSCLRVSE